jgi:hypothetical protein
VIDFRLYRLALLPSIGALIITMFSLVSRPEPLRSGVPTGEFDPAAAAGLERSLLEAAPEREPGSAGDQAAARFVEERFLRIVGGQISLQSFGGSFEGEDVDLENVVLALPGVSNRRVVVVAPRDCAGGPCAASSGAATATLIALAEGFNAASHEKTLVFVSTDGSTAGAAGAGALAEALRGQPLDGVVVVSQPGATREAGPYVVASSSGAQSTSEQLFRSAKAAVAEEAGRNVEDPGTLSGLLRLAAPSGLGEQAPVIERGLDSVAISAAGERPLEPEEDERFSQDAIDAFGRATLSLIQSLDAAEEPLVHGPSAYIRLGGKLVPGWALALLALTLLLPVGLVAIDGLARASRAGQPAVGAVVLVLRGALPFLAVLALVYLLGLVGLVARPAFPYDPGRFSFGLGAAAVLLFLAGGFAATVRLMRPLRPPAGLGEAVAPALGLVLFAVGFGEWLANPYLALLLVPTVHLWLFASLPRLGGGVVARALLGALGLLALVAVVADLATRLGVGLAVPWQLLLMVTGGHVGLAPALLACLLGGCSLSLAAAVIAAVQDGQPARRSGSGGDKELDEYASVATHY